MCHTHPCQTTEKAWGNSQRTYRFISTTCTDLTNLRLLGMHIMIKRLGNSFCIWPSEWNHSAIYQIHYIGVTWSLWCLKSLVTLLIVQQLLQANKYENKMSILPAFCEGNPPVISGSPNQGTVMWKVLCYFNRNSILENKLFFWWPILLMHMHQWTSRNSLIYDSV